MQASNTTVPLIDTSYIPKKETLQQKNKCLKRAITTAQITNSNTPTINSITELHKHKFDKLKYNLILLQLKNVLKQKIATLRAATPAWNHLLPP